MQGKEEIREYFNNNAHRRSKWKRRNRFYHRSIEKYMTLLIPKGSKVIEIGCGTGELLHAVRPSTGFGIDFSEEMIKVASENFPQYSFKLDDVEELSIKEPFDYVILSDLVCSLWDIQKAFRNIRDLCNENTRIIISNYNYLWEPILKIGEFFRIKLKQPTQNWLSAKDIENLLNMEGFETIRTERKLLFPKYIPLLNIILNSFLANLPLINHLNLINFIVARKPNTLQKDYSISIVIPARNEMGNIKSAITRIPEFGSSQEFIFVEGNSSDGTYNEMLRVQKDFSDKNITVFKQSGKGKGNAVREGFEKATGDILMILDSDLTTPPEDLPKFYSALKNNKGEFINGCRLVYPMESQAMRLLNLIANKLFGVYFTYLLGQQLKDTLCGTKVLFRSHYKLIETNRSFFGDFDPFGDFDLIFGAAKLNLKITEVNVRYKDRTYGSTQISRFSHGWLLVRMSMFAARKIKFR